MPKGWIKLQRIPFLCHGLINHSLRYQQLTWMLPTIPQDPNLTITMLYTHLQEKFSGNAVRAPVFYLQADNCYKENKNKSMMFFCSLLVKWDWFEEVFYSFLPKGHTHEDIDRLFSFLRIVLTRDEYSTLDRLISYIMPRAYNQFVKVYGDVKMKPTAKVHPPIYDWKSWIEPYLPPIAHHTKPHVFHFKKSASNPEVCIFAVLQTHYLHITIALQFGNHFNRI